MTVHEQAVSEHQAIQKPVELELFAAALDKLRPKRILEIGTWQGGMLWWFQQLYDPEVLVAVDVDTRAPRDAATHLTGDSRDPAIVAAARRLGPYDLVLIDGDHSYEGCRADFDNYAPMVRAGGIVALHDVLHHPDRPDLQVEAVWREIEIEEQETGVLSAAPWTWGGIGLVYV